MKIIVTREYRWYLHARILNEPFSSAVSTRSACKKVVDEDEDVGWILLINLFELLINACVTDNTQANVTITTRVVDRIICTDKSYLSSYIFI